MKGKNILLMAMVACISVASVLIIKGSESGEQKNIEIKAKKVAKEHSKEEKAKEETTKKEMKKESKEETAKEETTTEVIKSKTGQTKIYNEKSFIEVWKKVLEDKKAKEEMKGEGVNIFPFSEIIGEEVKFGYKNHKGEIVVPAEYDETFQVNNNYFSKVLMNDLYYSFDLRNKAVGKTGYKELYFVDENVEIGLIEEQKDNKVLNILDVKSGQNKKIDNIEEIEVKEKILVISLKNKEKIVLNNWGKEICRGKEGEDRVYELIGDGVVVERGRDVLSCKSEIYMNDGTFMGEVKDNYHAFVWKVEDYPLKLEVEKDGYKYEDREIRVKGKKEVTENKVLNQYKGKVIRYIGKGIVWYMEDDLWQGRARVKFHVIHDLKTGKKTEEIYHNVLRIDENRILGVLSNGIQILDNNLNILKENKMSYYEKYYKNGDVLIGENISNYGITTNIYLDLDGNVLWEDSIKKVPEDEIQYVDVKESYYQSINRVNSLKTIARQVLLSEKDKKVNGFIEKNIVQKIMKEIQIAEKKEEMENQKWFEYNTIFVKRIKNIYMIHKICGSTIYGARMGAVIHEKIYVSEDGELLDKDNIFIDGYEEELEKIIRNALKENGYSNSDKRGIDVERLCFEFSEEGIIITKEVFVKGAADWMMDVEVSFDELSHILNRENELVKRIID